MAERLLTILLGLSLLAAFAPKSAIAQTSRDIDALRKEVEALKEGQKAIRKELGEIQSLLLRRQAPRPAEPRNVVLSVDDDPFKGEKNAKVTLIDFSDFQ